MICPNCNHQATSYSKFVKVSLAQSFISRNKNVDCRNCGEELKSDPFRFNRWWGALFGAFLGGLYAKQYNPAIFEHKLMNMFLIEFPILVILVLAFLFFTWLYMKDRRVELTEAGQ